MSNSWWDSKLGGGNVQPRPYTPQYPAPASTPPVQSELAGRLIPASATNTERCPNCSSSNYGRVTPESKARCYDCGYPIQQSGSGTPGVRVPNGGAVQAAKQISTANNYNPGQIIDRIT